MSQTRGSAHGGRVGTLAPLLPLCLALGLGCFSTPAQLSVGNGGVGGAAGGASSRRGVSGGNGSSSIAGTSSAASSGSSGGGAASTGAGSTVSSSQGSSSGGGTGGTGGGSCSAVAGDQGGGIFDCNAPQLVENGPSGCTNPYFVSTVQDLASCGAVCGATVSLLDPSGAPIPGATAFSDSSTGIVEICLPGDVTYTPTVSADDYPLFYYGEIQGQLQQPLAGLGVLSNEDVMAFASFVSGYTPQGANLVVFTYQYSECGGQNAGWSVALALPDGGPWPDGGYLTYYCEDGTGYPSSMLTATTSYGVAILTNIDPNISSVANLVFTNPNAVAPCVSINQSVGFTGRIRLASGDFSIEPILLP